MGEDRRDRHGLEQKDFRLGEGRGGRPGGTPFESKGTKEISRSFTTRPSTEGDLSGRGEDTQMSEETGVKT